MTESIGREEEKRKNQYNDSEPSDSVRAIQYAPDRAEGLGVESGTNNRQRLLVALNR
jgi:hypothetical protein